MQALTARAERALLNANASVDEALLNDESFDRQRASVGIVIERVMVDLGRLGRRSARQDRWIRA